jgi:hypothetical protein
MPARALWFEADASQQVKHQPGGRFDGSPFSYWAIGCKLRPWQAPGTITLLGIEAGIEIGIEMDWN